MNKLERLIANRPVFAALLLVLVVRLLTALPLDSSLPGGTDTSSHLFRVWHIQQYGITGWSSEWYCGFDFLAGYSPLFYLQAGMLAPLLGHVLSYKLVIDVFWLLAPLCFLLLLREWKLPPAVTATALLVFSFLPIYPYYLYDGRHPTLVALPFALLYLKFALRASTGKKGWVPAGLFLSLAILAHLLTAVLAVVLSLVFMLRRPVKLSMLRSLPLAALIASPWLAIFALNAVSNPTTTLLEVSSPLAAAQLISASYLRFLDYPWTPPVVALSLSAILLLSLFAFRTRDRTNAQAMLMLALIGVLISVMSYNRALLFAPIPLAVLAARGLHTLKDWRRPATIILLLLLLIPVVHSLPVDARQLPTLPTGQGRVLLLPANSLAPDAGASWESYLLPAAGADYVLGWYPQAESAAKTAYNLAVQQPSASPEYAQLLRAGYVNYVLVDRSSNLTGLFSSLNYVQAASSKDYILFALSEPASYIELDGIPFKAAVLRQTDAMTIEGNCSPGDLTIKESWAVGWSAKLNGKPLVLRPDMHGFMQASISSVEQCIIRLEYSPFGRLFKSY
jgi:hypothetical protein